MILIKIVVYLCFPIKIFILNLTFSTAATNHANPDHIMMMLQTSLLHEDLKTQLQQMIKSQMQATKEKAPSTEIKKELPGYLHEVWLI